jgi:hypothetical protein
MASGASVIVVAAGRAGRGEQQIVEDPSWLKLVRTLAAVGDGFEGLAEVVGEGVGGGDGMPSGLDPDGAVVAGCLDEFPD